MKQAPTVVYIGSTFTTDCDFPLIRQLHQQGVNVYAYFPLYPWGMRSGLIDCHEMAKTNTILPASEVPSFKVYGKYIDLDRVFVVNNYYYKRYDPRSWWLWYKVLRHIRRLNPDLLHTAWPLGKCLKVLYGLKCPQVLTVHDPLPHSNQKSSYAERTRELAFRKADRMVLLNKVQADKFKERYGVPDEKIDFSSLGDYECIRHVDVLEDNLPKPYILFFGQIFSYKGVDILLEAMKKVHDQCPELNLVIAGKGNFNFDVEQFKRLDYIQFRHHYVSVPELAGLLQNCQFAVCPYKDATQSGVVQTAFSANAPLIVTNVGALPEVVKDGVFGLVVPPSDVDALADAIVRLYKDQKMLGAFRQNIREQWLPTVSWTPIAEQYIESYKKVLRPTK